MRHFPLLPCAGGALGTRVNSTSPTGPVAVLLDIDGTLVDSNYLHVDAWDRAFVAAGHPVDAWRIHRSIGMDSAKLGQSLLGDAWESVAESVKEEQGRIYLESVDRLRPIGGARELLAELDRRGHTVVLATSAPQEELDALLTVLRVADSVAAVTSAEDVETAKPAPDIIEVALERASTPAARAVMVGDSVWDIEAAARVDVVSIGLLSGGSGREELLAAGAAAVYEDAAELLASLGESPISRPRDR